MESIGKLGRYAWSKPVCDVLMSRKNEILRDLKSAAVLFGGRITGEARDPGDPGGRVDGRAPVPLQRPATPMWLWLWLCHLHRCHPPLAACRMHPLVTLGGRAATVPVAHHADSPANGHAGPWLRSRFRDRFFVSCLPDNACPCEANALAHRVVPNTGCRPTPPHLEDTRGGRHASGHGQGWPTNQKDRPR